MYIERDDIGIIITGGAFAREYVYRSIKDAQIHIDMINGHGDKWRGRSPKIVGKWLDLALSRNRAISDNDINNPLQNVNQTATKSQ